MTVIRESKLQGSEPSSASQSFLSELLHFPLLIFFALQNGVNDS